MSYFWVAKQNISPDMGFSLYHLPHLFWLGGIAAGGITLVWLCRRLSMRNAQRIIRVLAWLMVGLELLKILVLWRTGQFSLAYLPLDLCGLSVYLELAAVYSRQPLLRACVYSLSLPGAGLALLFPNWFSLPLWNFCTLHGFLLHGLLVWVPVLLCATGQLYPCVRQLPFCAGLLCLLCLPISVVNRHFGTNFFFLSYPSAGSPLEWFDRVLGNHLLGMPLLVGIIWLGLYGLPWCWHRCRAKHGSSVLESKL